MFMVRLDISVFESFKLVNQMHASVEQVMYLLIIEKLEVSSFSVCNLKTSNRGFSPRMECGFLSILSIEVLFLHCMSVS